MPISISSLAQMEVQTSLLTGKAQASTMGLGQKAADALALGTLLDAKPSGGKISALLGSVGGKSRLSGAGLRSDLKNLADAAVAGMMTSSGSQTRATSGLGSPNGGGSIISLKA